jgi:hypothetical protein
MTSTVAFMGMRGNGDWATDERPKSWRETILYLYPNGMAPLTAMMSKMGEEKVTDPEFNWWTQKLPTQSGAITGIFTDVLSTPYVSGGAAAATLYVQMALATIEEFRVGHQILLRCSTDTTLDVVAKVTARTDNGASSYLTIKLLEADDNSTQSKTLANADRILVIGNINEEGATMPNAISYMPTKYSNYTQIFRTPLSITRTARETRLRTGDQYKRMKKEALEMHGIEMEKSLIFSIPTEGTGDGGKPERTTAGLLYFLRTHVPTNVSDFRINSTYSGKAWADADAGEAWFDTMYEQLFRYGRPERLAFCGSGALLGINQLVRANSHFELTTKTVSYGIKVTEWVTPFGTIYLKTHPLMSQESSTRYGMLLMDAENLKYRYITDTTFYGMSQTGAQAPGGVATAGATYGARKDGTDEEYLTEMGLELHHPDTFMYLDGVGCANAV